MASDGWGGCVVALFDLSAFRDDEDEDDALANASPERARAAIAHKILETIVQEYYVGHLGMRDREPTPDAFKDLLFVADPAGSAAIYAP